MMSGALGLGLKHLTGILVFTSTRVLGRADGAKLTCLLLFIQEHHLQVNLKGGQSVWPCLRVSNNLCQTSRFLLTKS